jgi:hypothetical protein
MNFTDEVLEGLTAAADEIIEQGHLLAKNKWKMLTWMAKLRSFTFTNRNISRSRIQCEFLRASLNHMKKQLEQYWLETTCTKRYFGASLLSPRRSVNLHTSCIVQNAPDFKSAIRSLGRGVRNFSHLTNVQVTAGYYSDISV